MSGPFGSQQWMYSTGFYPYEIDQSLRFNDDDSAYLSRTPASASNQKTWTWSGWVKRGNMGAIKGLFGASLNFGNVDWFNFEGGDTLQYVSIVGGQSVVKANVRTTAVFRDPSAWYHVVLVIDYTETTGSDRVKIYVNGVSQSLTFNATPSSTDSTMINSTNAHFLGRALNNSNPQNVFYYDGYMAEVNFIDGQALDPTSFGELKSGVWIPKSYSGSYGTNGFYLGFGNSGSLGADSSGNGNNWTPNNLAATDQVLDSPTNNFATLNPLYQPLLTYSEGNLRTYYGGAYAGAEPTMWTGKNEKYYSEELIVALGGDRGIAVIADNGTESIGWVYNGNTYGSLGSGFVMPSYTTGDIIGYAIDGTTNQVQFYKNGVAAGSAWQFSTAAPLGFRTHMGYMYGGSDAVANFGQDSSFAGQKTAQGYTDANGIGDFYYAPPSGYLALCTANLPDPAIDPAVDDVPEDYFNTVLYTGDGASSRSITGVGFQPDLVWVKSRNNTWWHTLTDSVRGGGYYVHSNDITSVEGGGGTSLITGFNSDGFNVNVSPNGTVNNSGDTYVGWNWLADNTSGSSNTDGTITSTVSANQKAGFSIVSYTGTGTNATVGHGLGSTPELVIWKNRSATVEWVVQSNQISAFNKLVLNSTAASATDFDLGNFSSTTSTTLALQNDTSQNASGQNIIAYCFHSVDGYSKIGSYTGNGSTDGPFVYTGFRPAFVIVKLSSAISNWIIKDTARDSYNVAGRTLIPDSFAAEFTNNTEIDILSNGFKIRDSGTLNTSSGTGIFMAFAEMPFKYANAR